MRTPAVSSSPSQTQHAETQSLSATDFHIHCDHSIFIATRRKDRITIALHSSRFVIAIAAPFFSESKVPQQKNDSDCGLFVLYFMERFVEEAPERLTKKDLHKFGKQWFQPEDASGLRERVKQLLREQFELARLEDGGVKSPSTVIDSDEQCSDS